MLGPEVARAEARAAELSEEDAVTEAPAVATEAAEPVLEADDLRLGPVQGVSFVLRPGEVLGIAALEGQGQDELFEALAGQRKPEGGEIRLRGKPLRARHPFDAIRRGVVLVPPDRLLALLPQGRFARTLRRPGTTHHSAGARSTSGTRHGRCGTPWTRSRSTCVPGARCGGSLAETSRRSPSPAGSRRGSPCSCATTPRAESTSGRSVRCAARPCRERAAILFFSSELSELPFVSDRVITLYAGRVTAELPGAAADEATLLQAMHGLDLEGEAA